MSQLLKPVRQAVLSPPEPRPPPKPETQHTAKVVRHLLWHKAMVGDDEDGRRITDYIEMVTQSAQGEHVGFKDGFHRDLAIAFELVLRDHIDPWDIDLSKFAATYMKEAEKAGADLVTSGRIVLLAWTVLKLQSQEAADRAVIRSEPEEADWQDIPDFSWSEDEVDYNTRLLSLPKAPIDEKIRHKGDRRVTLMELLSALEEVHSEAQARMALNEQRLAARLSLKRRMRGKVGSMMHREDLEEEIGETWTRLHEYPGSPVPFSALHESTPADVVQTFNALLFLAHKQRVTVTQEDFPYGEIWVTPREVSA